MNDDFNATKFLGALFDRLRRLNGWLDKNTAIEASSRDQFIQEIKRISGVLGVFGDDPIHFFEGRKKSHLATTALSTEVIESKILERNVARKNKDFKKSDEIRQELASSGIEIRDNPDGTTSWGVK